MGKFTKITDHVYHVENQNGFNNALYDYFDVLRDDGGGTREKKEIREMVQNFPKKYPTTIVIVDQSFECRRVYIENFDLSKEYEKIKVD